MVQFSLLGCSLSHNDEELSNIANQKKTKTDINYGTDKKEIPSSKSSGILYVSFKFDIDDSRAGKSITMPIYEIDKDIFVNSGTYNMNRNTEEFGTKYTSFPTKYNGENLYKRIYRRQKNYCQIQVGKREETSVWVDCPTSHVLDLIQLISRSNIAVKSELKVIQLSSNSEINFPKKMITVTNFRFKEYKEENGVKKIKIDNSLCGEDLDLEKSFWIPLLNEKEQLTFDFGFAPC